MAGATVLLPMIFGSDYIAAVPVFRILIWTAPLYIPGELRDRPPRLNTGTAHSLTVNGLHLSMILLFLPPLASTINGAAWAAVLAGAVGAGYGCWLLWQQRLPLHVKRLWAILVATVTAGIVAWVLPGPWYVAMLVGGAIYGGVWATGVVSASISKCCVRPSAGRVKPDLWHCSQIAKNRCLH